MPILHLILSPLARFDNAPILERWLARGDRLPDALHGREAVLRDVFQFSGASTPVAALLRNAIVHDAGENIWVCADPAYVRAEANGARLLAFGDDLDVTAQEAEALTRSLRPLFGDAGAPLEITMPSHWCLRLPRGAQVPMFATPDDALGANLLDHLPQGDSGRRWRALFNETQMLLHAHPVNIARRERGQMPVNALWFWGAGTLPMGVKTSFERLASNDPLVRALAQRANVPVMTPTIDTLDSPQRSAKVLFDLRDRSVSEFDGEWLPRIDRALRRGKIKRVDIAFVSGERFRIKRWHRWRLWRRAASSPGVG